MTNPTVRSEPPSARTWSGSRKKDAKVRKKQNFAIVTRTNAGDSRDTSSDLPLTAAQYTWARDGCIRTSARDPAAPQAAQGVTQAPRPRAREGDPQGARRPQREVGAQGGASVAVR